ncbi:hypothetical protein EYC80_001676 [Monilinia laxa]|uniref:Serine/threonine-protein phosphatase n=1 Tax=Monilinia laxa TaxID=61186 RepID=A0A5N6K5P0_MONLA|nr:hypothetical protein EYC80_001676 [Monilinia laxa]
MPGLPSSVDLDQCIESLYKKNLLAESVIEAICAKTKELLMQESNVVHVLAPITVVGDIHGQFFDLIEIFKIGGFCPDTNYLFLGDYVDRGMFSVETISLLVCLKLRYPHRVHLIRGNHESRGVTQSYGFYTECSRKYGNANVWHHFTDMFDFLTLSVVINDQIFCVHGGLSPSIHSIDQIKIIDRFREIPHEGPMADLVWSDPDPERDEFSLSPRGAGYTFGAQVVKKFLEVNKMSHILRAHQLCQEGYQVLYDDRLSTVWSAPNYCYRCGNMASVLEVSDTGERFFNVFAAAPENDLHKGEMQQAGQDKTADGNTRFYVPFDSRPLHQRSAPPFNTMKALIKTFWAQILYEMALCCGCYSQCAQSSSQTVIAGSDDLVLGWNIIFCRIPRHYTYNPSCYDMMYRILHLRNSKFHKNWERYPQMDASTERVMVLSISSEYIRNRKQ